MSRKRTGVRLPYALEQELGLDLRQIRDRRNKFHANDRQGQHNDRVEKRKPPRGGRQNVRGRQQWEDQNNDGSHPEPAPVQNKPAAVIKSTRVSQPDVLLPRSILRKARRPSPSPSTDDESTSSRSLSPEIVLDASSRSYQDRLAQDDDEIEVLEKRLGLKNKKSSKTIDEDGLGDLLGGFNSDDEDKKRKREEKEWLQRKRRRRDKPKVGSGDEAGDKQETDGASDSVDEAYRRMKESAASGAEGDDPFSGFDSEEVDEQSPQQPAKVRENPYLPPVAPSASATKYIPPSLRKLQSGEDQSLQRLKRQVQGHLNKLSEANLISILKEIETIYSSNPRQDVTSTLLDLLLSSFCERAALQTTFVLLHAAFCSAVYKVIGTDFGAELLARLVDRFSHYYNANSDGGKEALNLISLLAHLFTFQLTSSSLVYSYIHLILSPLSEPNTELLLRIIRDCGPQLRSDDPSALKKVVTQTQTAAQSLPPPVSVRTQFMLETITDLKNNKMRGSTANSDVTREHITRLRKTLGSLSSRSLRATEPLRLTLDDLQHSDRRGKWWLVGASWKGNSPSPNPHSTSSIQQPNGDIHDAVPDYPSLARHLSLTTPLQTSILTAIASSSNAADAFVRLSKLRLKRAQEPEVSRVLLRCCAREDGFNTYYSDLARKLCSGEAAKQWTKRFEFSFWAFVRRLGEGKGSGDEGEGEGGDVAMTEVFNTAKLYAHLVHDHAVSLGVLRPLDLLMLSEQGSMFVELLFVNIFTLCKGREDEIRRLFVRLSEAKQVIGQVRVFLKRVVKDSDFVERKGGDAERLRLGVKVAVGLLDSLSVDK